MKRAVMILVTMICLGNASQAQTFNEWFRQKKTQRQYLVQQIAAFRLYYGYLRKGYDIAKQGTGTIHRITSGEFSLHDTFLSSLKRVNPRIRQYVKVADFLANQATLVKTYKEAMNMARNTTHFTTDEMELFGLVFSALLDDATESVEELLLVLADNALQLADAQRLGRIDRIYAKSIDQNIAARLLYNDIHLAVANRDRTQTELDGMKVLYDIEN